MRDKFEKIIEAVKATGAEAKKTAISAGCYFDGTQHGEIFDIVMISVDRYDPRFHGCDTVRVARDARKAAARFKDVTVKEVNHNSFYIYHVFNAEDLKRAETLQKEAEVFLEAFYVERHRQHINGEPDNADKAIKAGHKALSEAGYSITAA